MGIFSDTYSGAVDTNSRRDTYIRPGEHVLRFIAARAHESKQGKGKVFVLEYEVAYSDTHQPGELVSSVCLPDAGPATMRNKRVTELAEEAAAVAGKHLRECDMAVIDAVFESPEDYAGALVACRAESKTTRGGGTFTKRVFSPFRGAVPEAAEIPF